MSDPVFGETASGLGVRWFAILRGMIFSEAPKDLNKPMLNPRGVGSILNPAIRDATFDTLFCLTHVLNTFVDGQKLNPMDGAACTKAGIFTIATYAIEIAERKGKPATVEQVLFALIFALNTKPQVIRIDDLPKSPLEHADLEAILFKVLSDDRKRG